jgi:RNA recognition motif-containing protein
MAERVTSHVFATGVEMGRKLYVGNLPFSADETQLGDLFASAGTVESVSLVRDQMTGRSRGFAFVEMSSDDEANQAITSFDQYQLEGRALTVNEARPKGAAPGGFGRGNGGRGGGGGPRRRSEPRW